MRVLLALAFALALVAGCLSSPSDESTTSTSTATPPSPLAFELITVDDQYGPSEPSILSAPDGTIWIVGPTGLVTPASEANPEPYTHDSGVWSSKDAGTTWAWNEQIPMYGRDACPGGGDSDIAASPDGSLFLIDLNLANVPIDVSHDGGETWLFNCATSILPGDDRQWVAADDQSVWILVNQIPTGGIVYRSDRNELPTDGLLFGPPTQLGSGNSGNIVIDLVTGTLYVGGSGSTIYVSHDRGDSFTPVETGLNHTSGGFVTVAVDQAGNVFVGGSSSQGFAVVASSDQGKTWSDQAVFAPYVGEYAFPWITAGGNGTVNFVWYGKPDEAPAGGDGYYLYAGQSLDVLTRGTNAEAEIVQVTPEPVLTIPICMGLGCGPGRALGDFFETTTDKEGHMLIAFNDANGHNPPLLRFARQVSGTLAPNQFAGGA